jgi:hypothetical protein
MVSQISAKEGRVLTFWRIERGRRFAGAPADVPSKLERINRCAWLGLLARCDQPWAQNTEGGCRLIIQMVPWAWDCAKIHLKR